MVRAARPQTEHVKASDFVVKAKVMGLSRATTHRLWAKLVSAVKGARYSWNTASSEYVTRGQLRKVVNDGRKKSGMRPTDWDAFLPLAEIFM